MIGPQRNWAVIQWRKTTWCHGVGIDVCTVKVKVAQSCPTPCDPVDYTVHGILQARILQWVAFPFSQGNLPSTGIKPRSPALWADSLLSEPPGKPKNTGVGSLSLLQQIFPTQELNRGLLHCRQIPYQLREAVSTVLCFKRQLHKHVYSHNL